MDTELFQILDSLGGAIAVIDSGHITWCSEEALAFGLMPGAPLELLLPQGVAAEELSAARQISLPNLGERVYARLCPVGSALLLVLQEELSEMNLNALAQTSRMLRIPMNDIMSTSRRLFERLEDMEDPAIQAQTASLNRSFYQLLRTASSISELQQSEQQIPIVPKRVELKSWLDRVMKPAVSAVRTTGRSLEVTGPSALLFAQIDAPMLEKALWCLLSNAIHYSPKDSVISMSLQKLEAQCMFTLRNSVSQPVQLNALSGGFARPLTVESEYSGLGLGILRAQRIIRQHGGVLLLSCTPEGDFVARFRIPSRLPPPQVCVTPKTEELGGFNRMLVELSDALPDEIYDSRNL